MGQIIRDYNSWVAKNTSNLLRKFNVSKIKRIPQKELKKEYKKYIEERKKRPKTKIFDKLEESKVSEIIQKSGDGYYYYKNISGGLVKTRQRPTKEGYLIQNGNVNKRYILLSKEEYDRQIQERKSRNIALEKLKLEKTREKIRAEVEKKEKEQIISGRLKTGIIKPETKEINKKDEYMSVKEQIKSAQEVEKQGYRIRYKIGDGKITLFTEKKQTEENKKPILTLDKLSPMSIKDINYKPEAIKQNGKIVGYIDKRLPYSIVVTPEQEKEIEKQYKSQVVTQEIIRQQRQKEAKEEFEANLKKSLKELMTNPKIKKETIKAQKQRKEVEIEQKTKEISAKRKEDVFLSKEYAERLSRVNDWRYLYEEQKNPILKKALKKIVDIKEKQTKEYERKIATYFKEKYKSSGSFYYTTPREEAVREVFSKEPYKYTLKYMSMLPLTQTKSKEFIEYKKAAEQEAIQREKILSKSNLPRKEEFFTQEEAFKAALGSSQLIYGAKRIGHGVASGLEDIGKFGFSIISKPKETLKSFVDIRTYQSMAKEAVRDPLTFVPSFVTQGVVLEGVGKLAAKPIKSGLRTISKGKIGKIKAYIPPEEAFRQKITIHPIVKYSDEIVLNPTKDIRPTTTIKALKRDTHTIIKKNTPESVVGSVVRADNKRYSVTGVIKGEKASMTIYDRIKRQTYLLSEDIKKGFGEYKTIKGNKVVQQGEYKLKTQYLEQEPKILTIKTKQALDLPKSKRIEQYNIMTYGEQELLPIDKKATNKILIKTQAKQTILRKIKSTPYTINKYIDFVKKSNLGKTIEKGYFLTESIKKFPKLIQGTVKEPKTFIKIGKKETGVVFSGKDIGVIEKTKLEITKEPRTIITEEYNTKNIAYQDLIKKETKKTTKPKETQELREVFKPIETGTKTTQILEQKQVLEVPKLETKKIEAISKDIIKHELKTKSFFINRSAFDFSSRSFLSNWLGLFKLKHKKKTKEVNEIKKVKKETLKPTTSTTISLITKQKPKEKQEKIIKQKEIILNKQKIKTKLITKPYYNIKTIKIPELKPKTKLQTTTLTQTQELKQDVVLKPFRFTFLFTPLQETPTPSIKIKPKKPLTPKTINYGKINIDRWVLTHKVRDITEINNNLIKKIKGNKLYKPKNNIIYSV